MRGSCWSFIVILSVIALGATTLSAQADDYWRHGGYIGGGYVYAAHLFEDKLNDALDDVDIDLANSSGFNLYGGYRLLSFLAVEAEYEYVDGFQGSIEGIDVFKIRGHNFTGNLRLIAPLWRVQPFFVVGLGSTKYSFDQSLVDLDLDLEESAFAIRVKGGIEGYITDNFGLSGAFGGTFTTHDLGDPTSPESLSGMHYLSLQVGVVYRF